METRIRKLSASSFIKPGPAASGLWTDTDGKLKYSVSVGGSDFTFEVASKKTASNNVSLSSDLTAASTLTAADSGRVFFLNSATEFATTLPAPVAGWNARFYVKAAPASASYTIVTASSANIIVGHVVSAEDAAGSGDTETSGADTITIVDGKAKKGDRIDIVCDGTNFYVTAFVVEQDAVTFTVAS